LSPCKRAGRLARQLGRRRLPSRGRGRCDGWVLGRIPCCCPGMAFLPLGIWLLPIEAAVTAPARGALQRSSTCRRRARAA
jgi:hypothetical protein